MRSMNSRSSSHTNAPTMADPRVLPRVSPKRHSVTRFSETLSRSGRDEPDSMRQRGCGRLTESGRRRSARVARGQNDTERPYPTAPASLIP